MEEVGMERSTACKRPRAALDGAGAAWRSCRVARAAAGGKDRHSKVVTARGLRDRRVRLSVPTAIQFYDIQDRLGVDQPSKAIEWLIRAAAAAIDELPSLDCSFSLPAAPSPPPPVAGDADADVSTSETSKGSSVLSLANNGGAFADLLHCSASDDKSMQQQQQQQQPTLAYYPVQLQPPSSHVTPGMSFETVPQLAFLQEPQHPAVVFDRGTLQSNAVAAAPLWPPTQHPCLLQRFASTAPADAAGLPFFLGGGGAAPATNAAERRIQLWDFKQERKA
ncbi:hypothetical protein PR202_gb24306 [Eleusine coracana subsp. coracana]|uniref:TCP domain-containing protein n=1 Tax=Eleusine coracana subsp. coracana TaxID=191504 RepID=A0AAV5FMN4_ELECO|nr:hypothetical protein QOZ80_5BG0446740 [Eleusine coracana subsp. coracana]GJN35521.1 hypothetical protein PR202_gb24306 [Eleusine coracana subsp. coracana]